MSWPIFFKRGSWVCNPYTQARRGEKAPAIFMSRSRPQRRTIEWHARCYSVEVSNQQRFGETPPMLESIIVVLVILWLVGMVSSYTMGGLIHVLLVIAVIVLLLRIIQGRRVV